MTQEPFPDAPVSVAIQSVLYHTPRHAIERMLEALDNSAEVGLRELFCTRVVVVLGDASRTPILSSEDLDQLRARFTHLDEIVYTYFDQNVGTSRGHNDLAKLADTDFLVTSNPDVVADARALWRLVTVFNDPQVGMAEAKQLPVEHPKNYDTSTGFTSWATTAFAMIRRSLFEQLGGFDADTFFMYCDDVDFSWRVREAGYHVVFHPAAIVFHDKRLTVQGKWMPTSAEHYYSAQAALLLPYKWSRDDVVESVMTQYLKAGISHQEEAVEEFVRRREGGLLVERHDPDNQIGTFVGYRYTENRFEL